MVFYIIGSILILIEMFLFIIILLSDRYLLFQKMYAYIFYNSIYRHYNAIISYNRIFERKIPVFDDVMFWTDDFMKDRFYIMDRELYFDIELLIDKSYSLLIDDLIKRNSDIN